MDSNDFEKYIRGEDTTKNDAGRRQLDSMMHVLSTRPGRRLIYELLGICHFGRSAFTGNNETTNALAGKQIVGEWVMGLLNLTYPEAFTLMVKEAKEDEEYDNRQRDTTVANADSTGSIATADRSEDQPG